MSRRPTLSKILPEDIWTTIRLGSPALLLVASVDGFPLVSLADRFRSGFLRLPDLCLMALIGLAIARRHLTGSSRVTQWRDRTIIFSLALATCCAAAVFHSTMNGGTMFQSLLFGRDYLFLAALACTLMWLFPTRAHWDGFRKVILAAGAVLGLFSVGVSIELLPPAAINAHQVDSSEGVTRIWSASGSLLIFVFALSVGNLLLARKASLWDIAVPVITGTSVILTLSRSLYFGLIAAIILAPLLWYMTSGSGSDPRRMVKRLLKGVTIVAAALVVGNVVGLAGTPIESISERATQGFTNINSAASGSTVRKNTFTYRLRVTDRMLDVLGDDWITGLGLIHPADRYFTTLKNGSIRDVDVGSLGPLMTMGIFGLILIYLPLLSLIFLTADYGPRSPPARRGFMLGILFWGLFILAASPTLGVVVNPETAILLGVVFGLALRGAEFSRSEWLAATHPLAPSSGIVRSPHPPADRRARPAGTGVS